MNSLWAEVTISMSGHRALSAVLTVEFLNHKFQNLDSFFVTNELKEVHVQFKSQSLHFFSRNWPHLQTGQIISLNHLKNLLAPMLRIFFLFLLYGLLNSCLSLQVDDWFSVSGLSMLSLRRNWWPSRCRASWLREFMNYCKVWRF
jgi:hypothetical protein